VKYFLSFCVLCLLAGTVVAKQEPSFHGSQRFFDFRQAGFEMIEQKMVDLDGNNILDAVVVEKSTDGMGLSIWKGLKNGDYEFWSRSSPVNASSLKTLKLIPVEASKYGLYVDVFEEDPDQVEHWAGFYGVSRSGLQKMFETKYYQFPRIVEYSWSPGEKFDFGGVPAGISIQLLDNGWPKFVVRHSQKRLKLFGQEEQDIMLVFGIRESVYQRNGGVYQKIKDDFINFLPMIATTKIQLMVGVEQEIDFQAASSIRMVRFFPVVRVPSDQSQSCQLEQLWLQFEDGPALTVDRRTPQKLDPKVLVVGDFSDAQKRDQVQTMVFLSAPISAKSLRLKVGSRKGDQSCGWKVSVHQALIDSK
jgi:hypothetical protein